MITVCVYINGTPIFTRSARNTAETKDGTCKYICDTGERIFHKRSDGFAPLAIKMLETVRDIDAESLEI